MLNCLCTLLSWIEGVFIHRLDRAPHRLLSTAYLLRFMVFRPRVQFHFLISLSVVVLFKGFIDLLFLYISIFLDNCLNNFKWLIFMVLQLVAVDFVDMHNFAIQIIGNIQVIDISVVGFLDDHCHLILNVCLLILLPLLFLISHHNNLSHLWNLQFFLVGVVLIQYGDWKLLCDNLFND